MWQEEHEPGTWETSCQFDPWLLWASVSSSENLRIEPDDPVL